MGPDDAVRLEQVSKRFGPIPALERADLSIPWGTFTLVAGANGAGKSTLLRLIAGLSKPTAGKVLVAGDDPGRRVRVRRKVGLLSHQGLFYGDLSARQNLLFFAKLYGLEQAEAQVEAALDQMGLLHRQDHRVATFSRGMKQRLALARAQLHRPEILLLDEPSTGLDRGSIQALEGLLHQLKDQGGTAMMVTHRLDEAADLADHLVLLRRGRVVHSDAWDGDLAQLEALYQRETTP